MRRVSKGDGESAEPVEGVRLELLAAGERVSAQAFDIEPGTTVSKHSHDNEQVGYVTQGTLTFLAEGEEIVCGPGDSFAIPGGEPHGAENRGEEAVQGVEMFSPPREVPNWDEG